MGHTTSAIVLVICRCSRLTLSSLFSKDMFKGGLYITKVISDCCYSHFWSAVYGSVFSSVLFRFPCITVCALVLLSSFVSKGPKGKSEQATGEFFSDNQWEQIWKLFEVAFIPYCNGCALHQC